MGDRRSADWLDPGRSGSRRMLVLGAAAAGAAVWLGGSRVRTWFAVDLEFTPLDDPPGFRRFGAGAVSAGFDPLTGLGSFRAEGDAAAAASVRADLCRALFGTAVIAAGTVPIAYFSDFRCPYCRVLSPRLAALEAGSEPAVTVAWHEWPILGEVSVTAARAALAARRQGAYLAFHERLISSPFVPTPAYLAELAAHAGLDPARLAADMRSPGVTREIATSGTLAGILRFRGTPGLVVGRTVVNGAIDEATLAALIERERADGPPPGCSSG
jgi:protein-disulfide isomerase